MITPKEIELFQSCRARWKLAKDDRTLDTSSVNTDDYLVAIRRTIFQMYSWLQEKDRFMTDRQVKERWDKNWWSACLDKGELEQQEILDKALSGWITLEKYWGEVYLEETGLTPVGINFEFSTYCNDVHYRIHTDLILADRDGRFRYRQLGIKKTEWGLYTSVATKLEIFGLTSVLGSTPIIKSHINLLASHGIETKVLNITPAYLRNIVPIINNISSAVKEHAIYASPGHACGDCPYIRKCWF